MHKVLNSILIPILLVVITGSSFTACQPEAEKENDDAGLLKIVCTTGMIGDAATHICGEHAEVISLMGPGVDPHLYKAKPGDLRQLREADIIFYNGLHLEGKMGEVLEKLAAEKPVYAVSDGLQKDQLLFPENNTEAPDPHIWFDLELWADAVLYMGDRLADHDSTHKETFRNANLDYVNELKNLHTWTAEEIASIPKESRVMITAHDAFSYFGKAYDIEVRGLQGISTVAEYGLRDVAELVNYISYKKIKAVFVESSISSKSLEAVVEGCREKGHEVKIGGTLYSDAMGDPGTGEGTYTGMVRHNVNTIVSSLQ